jgi:hypothetical protein
MVRRSTDRLVFFWAECKWNTGNASYPCSVYFITRRQWYIKTEDICILFALQLCDLARPRPRVIHKRIASFVHIMQTAAHLGIHLELDSYVTLAKSNAHLRHNMQFQYAKYIQARRSTAAHLPPSLSLRRAAPTPKIIYLETQGATPVRLLAPSAHRTARPLPSLLSLHLLIVLRARGLALDLRRCDELDILPAHGHAQILRGLAPRRQRDSTTATRARTLRGNGALAAEAAGLGSPEGGKGVEAVVVGGRLVAEDHDASRERVEQDVEPAV